MTLLDAQDLHIHRGKKCIVEEVSLTVERGEVLAICGPNGAGKSTLLGALSGQLPCPRIRLLGRPLTQWDRAALARTRAVLSQHSTLSFPLRVQEVVALGRHAHPSSSADPQIVAQCMERAGVMHLFDRRFTTLSGGERQRVHLARVLAQLSGPDAALLMLDEPTSALDPAQAEQMLSRVHALARSAGLAVIMVLHDLDQAAAFADRVLWMREGRAVDSGPVRAMFTPDLLFRTYGIRTHITSHPDNGRPLVVIARPGEKHGAA